MRTPSRVARPSEPPATRPRLSRLARLGCKLLAVAAALGCAPSPADPMAGAPLSGTRGAEALHSARPNIVVLLADDLAPGYLGFEGHPLANTPHLDRLAEGGRVFTRAYVPLAQCAPSRAALHSGRRPYELGTLTNAGARLAPDQPTVSSVARGSGYRTAFFGKWHLGDAERPQAGFEHWRPFVHPRYTDPEVWQDGQRVAQVGHSSDVLVDRALEYLDQLAAEDGGNDSPFLLWFSFKTPHLPAEPPPDPALRVDPSAVTLPPVDDAELAGLLEPQRSSAPRRAFLARDADSLRRESAAYHGRIAALDRSIGRLDAELARRGLADDTLVLFLSDNGWLLGQHGMVTKGALLYEELVRVPCVVRWPARVEPGTSAELVSTLDLFPTVAELAGAAAPPRRPFGGRSLLPLLGPEPRGIRDELFLEYWKKKAADDLVPMAGVVTAGAKYTRYVHSGEEAFYDLVRDPGERVNRAQEASPELEHLRARADAFVADWPGELRTAR